ncbi:acyltransferase family protein [Croceibacterium ferulae]|uniref:acyltransferase family protein n=1 Tax=Croceibacterium ferulae TaxID=1854641 RepID=UPI000EB2A498|nr:acyltransferase family protein [Croceibacterium ferulae]
MMHCTQLTELLGIEAPLLEAANVPLGAVRMPLFFVVSGVFAASGVSRSWSDLLQRKVALFVWLLLIWSVIRFLFVSYVMLNPDNPLEGTRLAEIYEVLVEPRTGIWFDGELPCSLS